MKRHASRTIGVALAATFCLSAAYQSINTESKVGYEYSDEDGNSIKILGVANITSDKVSAWDTSGEISESLAKKLDEVLRTRSQQDIQFRFGKKNRYIIVESDKSNPSISWRSDGDDYMQNLYLSGSSAEKLSLYRVTRDPASTKLSLSASINSTKQNKAAVPVVTGKKTEVNGLMYEYVSATPVETPVSTRYTGVRMKGKCWKLIFKTEATKPDDQKKAGTEMQMGPYYGMSVSGADGKPILYVDMAGNPVSAETYLLDPDQDQQYDTMGMQVKGKTHKYTRASTITGMTVSGAMSVQTNINPAKIKVLNLTWTTSKNIRFSDLLLDPK